MHFSTEVRKPSSEGYPRWHEPEWMDEPTLDPALHRHALQGLARLNVVGRSAAIVWPAIVRACGSARSLRVLDIACGGGDVTCALARRARRAGLDWRFAGCDKSQEALAAAAEKSGAARIDIDWFACDVLAEDLPERYDVVLCSLFLHHLAESEAVAMLARMGAVADRGVIVSDLRRSRANYALTWVGCRLLTRSPVVHYDGPLSIRCAFTVGEARLLAEQAGLRHARIATRFPVRWLLEWSPS